MEQPVLVPNYLLVVPYHGWVTAEEIDELLMWCQQHLQTKPIITAYHPDRYYVLNDWPITAQIRGWMVERGRQGRAWTKWIQGTEPLPGPHEDLFLAVACRFGDNAIIELWAYRYAVTNNPARSMVIGALRTYYETIKPLYAQRREMERRAEQEPCTAKTTSESSKQISPTLKPPAEVIASGLFA